MSTEWSELPRQLSASVKVERDRALLRLKLNTTQLSTSTLQELETSLFATALDNNTADDAVTCTALSAIAHLLGESSFFAASNARTVALVNAADARWLSHPDARVRSALSDALVQLSRRDVNAVRGLLQRRVQSDAAAGTVESWRALACALAVLKRAMTSVHGTVERSSVVAVDADTDDDVALLTRVLPPTLTHPNRFVREPAFHLLATVLDRLCVLDTSTVLVVGDAVARGLNDEWSEVLFGASVAVRALLTHPSLVAADAAVRSAVLDAVIPAMCMNRHNTVEGVRSWSQNTWRSALGGVGQAEAMQRLPAIVTHLEVMSRSNNDAMRDSAGACVAEAVRPLAELPGDNDDLAVHLVPRLVQIVKNLLTDASWWVRSTACVACGDLLSVAARHLDESQRNALLSLLESLTYDNLVSVRERSAEALAAAVVGCGADVVRVRIGALIDANLERAFNETVHRHVMVPVPESRARVLQPKNLAHLSEVASHSDNIMLGCCAHVPTNAQESMRPATHWEYSDGCVLLLREFARLWPDDARFATDWLPTLMRLATLSDLRLFVENIWKALPPIADAVGGECARTAIMPHVWPAYVASRELSPLVKSTATAAVRSVAQLIGINDVAALQAALQQANNAQLVADIAQPWTVAAPAPTHRQFFDET
jgi:hypothetical protein